MTAQTIHLKSALEQAGPDSRIYEAVPSRYRSLVWAVVEAAAAMINNGGHLSPCVIVGSSVGGEAKRVDISLSNQDAKRKSFSLVREAAKDIEADFAITSIESWSLTPEDRPRRAEICAKYGSIQAYPGRVEAAWFVLETHDGAFASQAVIERIEAKGHMVRVMLDPEHFSLSDEMQGELVGLLAPINRVGTRARMH